MRHVLLFIVLAGLVYGWRELLPARGRKVVWRGARSLVVPILYASAVTAVLVFFQLHTNGKIL